MPPLITSATVLARPGFGDATPEDIAGLLDDASGLVRDIADPLLDDVEEPDTPESIVPVVVSMVRRGLDNPRELSGEQIGDYGWQSQGGSSSGSIYATRREVRIIRRAVRKLGAGSVQLTGELPITENTRIFDDDLLGS